MGGYNSDIAFVHIPKTAGWTVKSYCRDVLPGWLMPLDKEGRRIDDHESGFPIGHVRLANFPRFTGREIDSWEKIIAVVREPHDQQVSQWKFWLDRYHRGGDHIHDRTAAKHGGTAQGPGTNLTKFLQDPRCDFHVWYEQHVEYPPRPHPPPRNRYEFFGGYYLYWLAVDGEIPDNVEIIYLDDLAERLPEILSEYTDQELPELPRTNTSPRGGETWQYYTPQGSELVHRKFRWAFENLYEPWEWLKREDGVVLPRHVHER